VRYLDPSALGPIVAGVSELNPDRTLALVTKFVDAFEVRHPSTGSREPIVFFQYMGGENLQHHAWASEDTPVVDAAEINELIYAGMLDADYHTGTMSLTPSAQARELVAVYKRAFDPAPLADTTAYVAATSQQRRASNPLSWSYVRPILQALRDYWGAAGYSAEGVYLLPLISAVDAENAGLARATIAALLRGGFLESTTPLTFNDVPAAVELAERAFEALDGWPAQDPALLFENLLAVLEAAAGDEQDEEKRRRLVVLRDTAKDLGVATVSGVLTKLVLGQ
jgi:hypothetical protein